MVRQYETIGSPVAKGLVAKISLMKREQLAVMVTDPTSKVMTILIFLSLQIVHYVGDQFMSNLQNNERL